MKQVAANYVVTDTVLFLKNGIATLGEDGIAAKFTDTGGDLKEIAQLIFYNGILFPNFQYIRIGQTDFKKKSPEGLQSIITRHLNEFQTITTSEFIELGILIQNAFPEMRADEIVKGITKNPAVEGNFIRQSLPGFILLQGADLVQLKFSAKCRLKQII